VEEQKKAITKGRKHEDAKKETEETVKGRV